MLAIQGMLAASSSVDRVIGCTLFSSVLDDSPGATQERRLEGVGFMPWLDATQRLQPVLALGGTLELDRLDSQLCRSFQIDLRIVNEDGFGPA
jgi:hypothetical protein